MITRRATVVLVSALSLWLGACASKPRALVVLLPEPDDATVGRAAVGNDAGSVDLDAARDATRVRTSQRPSDVTTMTEAEVQRIFGAALAALPPSPVRFVLNFRFQSDELTEDSRALVSQVLEAVRARPAATVAVTGHTDTMGTTRANHGLGLRRAEAVRKLLVKAGLDPARIQVSSLGETDLLVHTKDEAPEPRNRRVDITVR